MLTVETMESALGYLWPRIIVLCQKWGCEPPVADHGRGVLVFGPEHHQKISLGKIRDMFEDDRFGELETLFMFAACDRDARWETRFAAMRDESGPVCQGGAT